MHPAVVGAVQSKTIWTAAALALLCNLAPLLPDYLKTLGVDPHTIQLVGSTCAVVMMILRTMTSTSLTDKGASNGNS